MERFFIVLIVTVFINLNALAEDKGVWDRYFRLVPEEQAHVYQGNTQRPHFKPESIKAFIWNIKKTQMMNWKQEFETFGKNQDLILLQEAYQNKLFNTTASTFKDYRWDMGISMYYVQDNDAATGTMIGSKVSPQEVVVKHSPDGEAVVHTPKAMTFAKYPIEGRADELLVISVHGINITKYGPFKRHMDQAAEQIENHSGPILFAGDFNTRTKARTAYLMKMIEKYGFKTVEFKNGHQRMRWKFTNNYLDHGFVRGLKVNSAYVAGEATGSDHKPMFIEMAVE